MAGIALVLNASDDKIRENFLSLKTPQDVASLLEVDFGVLVYHIYRQNQDANYTRFKLT